MKKIFTILFFAGMLNVFGQEASIYGKITDISNNPIPFTTVIVKETKNGTNSANDGSYKIENLTNGNYNLQFSSLGYKTTFKKINITNNESVEVNVTLEETLEQLNEVVITSNRTRETLDEVPSSVSVVSAQQIRDLSQTSNSIADVLTEVPGISLSTNRVSSTGQTLRGRNMLILIDGIPQSTPLRKGGRDINTIDPSSLERIEVIKGATAIYGNGADGGIVNYITKKANATKKLESTTQIGSEGALVNINNTLGSKLTQTFSGKLNKFGYVVSGSLRQTGIYKDANGEVISPYYGLGETSQYSVFTKLNYEISAKQRIELMYNYFSSNQDTDYIAENGIYNESPTIGVLGESLGADQGNKYNHNIQVVYDFDQLFKNTDFRLNLYTQDFKTIYGFSDSFYNPTLGYAGGQSSIVSSKKGARLNFKTSYTIGDLNGDILYGGDILNDKTAQVLVDGRKWVPEMDMTNIAPYAQLKTIYNNFVLKAGIRFENINIGVPNFITIPRYTVGETTPNSGGVAIQGGTIEYGATTFNVGLRYNKWAVFKPFVSFSQSFSIADLGRTLRSATENTVNAINSEAVIANNYEIGFNSHLGKIRLSGAYYLSTSDLGSTYSETASGAFEILRQPEKVNGFEFALDTELTRNLFFGTSFSYTEGKVDTEDNGNYDTYIGGDRIPPLKVVSYVNYNLNTKFNVRLSHIYSGNRDRFEPTYSYGKGPVSSFNVFNLTSNYQLTQNTNLAVGIRNLFNEDYYPLISQWNARDSNYIKANGAQFTATLTVKL